MPHALYGVHGSPRISDSILRTGLRLIAARALVVISYGATRPHIIRMTIVRDRLSRHRELLGSSKVVFLSPRVAVERVTSAVVLSLVGSAVTLSAYLLDKDHVRADEVHEMRADALIGALAVSVSDV